jgi:cytochrome d ubiquinol oxidase subunit I
MERLSHVISGAILAGSFLALSVGAYYLVRKVRTDHAKAWMPLAFGLALFGMTCQVITGHTSAVGVSINQPAKMAAMEGHWLSHKPANLYLWGWVNNETEQTHGLSIPGGTSFLLSQDFNTPVTGLDRFKVADRPNANWTFQTYHLMLYAAGAMAALLLISSLFLMTGRFYDQTWLLKLWIPAVLLPQIANQAGWFCAELGRQPWVVYNLLRTSEALSKAVGANQVFASLILFTLVYMVLFALFIFLLDHKIRTFPLGMHDDPERHRRAEAS